MQEGLPPYGMRSEAALVKILGTIVGAFGTESFKARKTFAAVAAAVGFPPPSYTIAWLQDVAVRPYGLDDSNTLVSEDHVSVFLWFS